VALKLQRPSQLSLQSCRRMTTYRYETVPGFFKQDAVGYIQRLQVLPSFGLLDDSKDRWHNFRRRIEEINASAPDGTCYKVLFVARHGQGWHNVGGLKYGTKDWDDHWSKLNGDGEIVWGPDPALTPKGISEAKIVNAAWKKELPDGMPMPDRWFSSPFSRSANTLKITFEDIAQPKPVILENLREMIGMHTCDKRSPRSVIAERFPEFIIEDGFTEADELWKPDYRENDDEMVVRLKVAMDKIMLRIQPEDVYISITVHTGTARALMGAVGHPKYDLPTGGVIAIVVGVHKV